MHTEVEEEAAGAATAAEEEEKAVEERAWEDAVGVSDQLRAGTEARRIHEQARQAQQDERDQSERKEGQNFADEDKHEKLVIDIHSDKDSASMNVFPSPLPSTHPPEDLLFDSIPLSNGYLKLSVSPLSAGCRAILMLMREEGQTADVTEVDIMRGETHTSEFSLLNAKKDVD